MFKTRFKIANFKIDKRFYVTMITALVAIILAHLFGLLTILKKGDNFIFYGYNADIISGRWGLKILSKINEIFFHVYNLNYLNNLMSLIIIAFTAYFTILIFDIKNLVYCSIWTFIFLVFPTVTSTLLYSFTSIPYTIALFLTIYSAYVMEKYKYGYLLSILCIWMGMGIYQAYIPILSTIFTLQIIKNSLTGRYEFKTLLKKFISYILIIIVSIALYIITAKLFILIYNIKFTSYQGIDTMGAIKLDEIPGVLYRIYITFFNMLSTKDYILFYVPPLAQTLMLKISIIGLLLISLYIIFKIFKSNKVKISKETKIFIVIILILLPIPLNSIYIMTREGYIHTLMIYSLVCIFLLPILLLELREDNEKLNINKKPLYRKISIILLSFVIIQYTYLSNLNYNLLYYSTEKSINYINRLSTKITEVKGFNTEFRWVFVGKMDDKLFKNSYMKKYKTYMTRMNGAIFNQGDVQNFLIFSQMLGIEPKWIWGKEREEIKNSKFVKEMPTYPNEGSIKIYKDTIVVKFSDK